MPLNIEFSLTDEDLEVIEHMVASDPTQEQGERVGAAWARRVYLAFGPSVVIDKVNKYRDEYMTAKKNAKKQGVPYKNAAEREADAVAERNALK